ncbi:hypothetical protein B296_00011662 [Ensete ventricosum]|uniref:Uncharacterized protein n=1 Tax=Ensete ventricosum TaxID=4639 RepID=A0A427AAI2_ENSVE|nr:hypothetical protein B296_00011662 [Ensete ventricosum]
MEFVSLGNETVLTLWSSYCRLSLGASLGFMSSTLRCLARERVLLTLTHSRGNLGLLHRVVTTRLRSKETRRALSRMKRRCKAAEALIMLNDEGGGLGHKAHQECSEPCLNSGPNHTLRDVSSSQSGGPQKGGAPGAISQVRHMGGAVDFPTISIVISHPEDIPKPDMSTSKTGASEGYDGISAAAVAASSKKVFLPTESDKDQCR